MSLNKSAATFALFGSVYGLSYGIATVYPKRKYLGIRTLPIVGAYVLTNASVGLLWFKLATFIK